MINETQHNETAALVAPFIAINRHRIGIDGDGVTTLVAFQGCPLRCKYCLNYRCWYGINTRYHLTPKELCAALKIDNLYFRTTKGGICFGGGEPAQYYTFIRKFREIAPPYWKITLETSLNVPKENIEFLLDVVGFWIIDIKDMNPEIYLRYTTKDNIQVLENLTLLSKTKARCQIRVPLIPEFNTKDDCLKSVDKLKEMGFDNFDLFKYVKRIPKTN